jgi:Ser-tRNA(Ala) deacylase AlaX
MEQPALNEHNKQEHPPMHTAEHILNQTMGRLYGCPRSRNTHIEKKKGKCDYILPSAPSGEEVREIERRVNEVIARRLPVEISFVDREELPPGIDTSKLPADAGRTLRVVRVGDYDACACAGAHVGNTAEIGTFTITSFDYNAPVLRLRFRVS